MTYLGVTVPVVGVGQLATVTSMTTASLALAVLVTVSLAVRGALTVRQRRSVAP